MSLYYTDEVVPLLVWKGTAERERERSKDLNSVTTP